jgi:hypothetical protein
MSLGIFRSCEPLWLQTAKKADASGMPPSHRQASGRRPCLLSLAHASGEFVLYVERQKLDCTDLLRRCRVINSIYSAELDFTSQPAWHAVACSCKIYVYSAGDLYALGLTPPPRAGSVSRSRERARCFDVLGARGTVECRPFWCGRMWYG